MGRQLRRPTRRWYAIRLGPELPWRAGRALGDRRPRYAEFSLELQGDCDRDVRNRRAGSDRVQGTDSGLGRRRQIPRWARPARRPTQSRQEPNEHLSCLGTGTPSLLRCSGWQVRERWEGAEKWPTAISERQGRAEDGGTAGSRNARRWRMGPDVRAQR